MHEEWEPWLVQDKDKRVLKKKGFRSCTWIKGPKQKQHQKKQKNKTLKRLFGLASKDIFLFGVPCFFLLLLGFEKCKNKKHTCVFCFFWRFIMVGENHQKTKKTQSKHKTNKSKNKTLKIFFLAPKDVFCFPCVFFCVLKCKNQTITCVFLFFEGFWLEKITKKQAILIWCLHVKTKQKKHNENQQMHPLRLNQKVSSEFWYFGFWFWGFGVIVILCILQAFRYTKITNRVYTIYVCVSYIYYMYVCLEGHDMIQEALRWIFRAGTICRYRCIHKYTSSHCISKRFGRFADHLKFPDFFGSCLGPTLLHVSPNKHWFFQTDRWLDR